MEIDFELPEHVDRLSARANEGLRELISALPLPSATHEPAQPGRVSSTPSLDEGSNPRSTPLDETIVDKLRQDAPRITLGHADSLLEENLEEMNAVQLGRHIWRLEMVHDAANACFTAVTKALAADSTRRATREKEALTSERHLATLRKDHSSLSAAVFRLETAIDSAKERQGSSKQPDAGPSSDATNGHRSIATMPARRGPRGRGRGRPKVAWASKQ